MKRYRMGARGQSATLFLGDAVKALRRLPAQSVHCCITSPPYYGLRDYGVDGQIGLEEAPDAYVARLVEVFREVRRVLRDDSVLWLNLGDSYAGGKQGRGDGGDKGGERFHGQSDRPETFPRNNSPPPGFTQKQLLGIPWRVAFALQADGWFLRSACPWVKRSPLPESVTDRPGTAHEYVFLLAKQARYFYDAEAVKVVASASTIKRAAQGRGEAAYTETSKALSGVWSASGQRTEQGRDFKRDAERGRNRRTSDWWFDSLRAILAGESSAVTDEEGDPLAFPVNPRPYKGSHFAVMPEALVEPCILAGTSAKGCCPTCGAPWNREVERTDKRNWKERNDYNKCNSRYQLGANGSGRGDGRADFKPPQFVMKGWRPSCTCPDADPVPCTILDPFLGSGTVAAVALRLGRSAIGIDLNEKYLGLAKQRVGEAVRKVKFRRATLL